MAGLTDRLRFPTITGTAQAYGTSTYSNSAGASFAISFAGGTCIGGGGGGGSF